VHRKPDVGRTWPVAVPQTSERIRRPFHRQAVAVERESARRLVLALSATRLPAPVQRACAPHRATTVRPPCANLYDAPNFPPPEIPAPAFAVTTTVEFSPAAAGRDGRHSWFTATTTALLVCATPPTSRRLVLLVNNAASQPGAEEHEDAGVDIAEALITLHLTVDAQAVMPLLL